MNPLISPDTNALIDQIQSAGRHLAMALRSDPRTRANGDAVEALTEWAMDALIDSETRPVDRDRRAA